MPIINTQDASDVEERVARVFGAGSPQERLREIRALFAEKLDFTPASGEVGLAGARASVSLPGSAARVATLEGVNVVYVHLDTRRVRNAEASEAVRLVSGQFDGDLMMVFTNHDASQLHLIYPSFEGIRPTLRRMVIERDLPRRTAVQQLSNIYWRWQEMGSLHAALESAFDVEAVTLKFFAEYKRVFENALDNIEGFGHDDEEQEAKKVFAQTLFNRLMFVYFISRKGWLSFDGDNDYLNALWNDYSASATPPVSNDDWDVGASNFHTDRLRPLFTALDSYEAQNLTSENVAHRLIGKVPPLNGGLFETTDSDNCVAIFVPDSVIRSMFDDLFDKFNFTVMESTPFDVEVAVDPEMLGKVFEELVTGRHDSGAYYTPRPVVSFMCREALKGYLQSWAGSLDEDAIRAFVDDRDTSGVSVSDAREIGRALDEVTVVDPACGSGAYLLGMMQELVELQTELYNVVQDSKSLYELKLQIIERNLYGADSDQFAVNIAMLRLWLSLSIEYDDPGDPPPLPNLDFKIVRGDSLLGPDPSPDNYGDLFRHQVNSVAERLADLKARFQNATGGAKDDLRKEIESVQSDLTGALADSPAPEDAVDWRVQFGEVFAKGGFDIAVANPPYIQLQKNGGRLGRLYRDIGYDTFARTGDIYQLFYERGCELLKDSAGLLAYITSNSWLRAEYGKRTRRYFSGHHTPLRFLDLGKDVFDSAIVDSGVLILRIGGESGPFPAVDMDRIPDGSFPPDQSLWGQIRPDGESPWSVLSDLEQSVMDKMLAIGTPLKEWDIEINYGIKTGYNKAFIIDNQTKEALVAEDPGAAEIIKPVLRGRDIRRYHAKWAELWLIDTHNGYGDVPAIQIHKYPSVKAHLDSFYDRLERRYDKGDTPYNLRNCAYHEDFAKEKLLWIELVDRGRFAYDNEGFYGEATTFLLTGESVKYLCAILNSTLIGWYLKQVAPTSGMGTLRWKKVYVERLPLPRASEPKRREFESILDSILFAQTNNHAADVSKAEDKINRWVYELCGLTPAEISIVDQEFVTDNT